MGRSLRELLDASHPCLYTLHSTLYTLHSTLKQLRYLPQINDGLTKKVKPLFVDAVVHLVKEWVGI